MDMTTLRFDMNTLNDLYRRRRLRPEDVIEQVFSRIERDRRYGAWISWFDAKGLAPYLERLRALSPELKPLYGVPFAVKDNIDVAGLPTTAGCPAYAYHPEQSAAVVEKLVEQGAIPIGKTNMDQFATGLNGTRSPYGICRNAFDPGYIAGGSSSGSAVALARGHVGFALGTDTAGSGRVPAALQGLIGHKPTRGVLSAQGVVPACRSLDTVSIFAYTAGDAEIILGVAAFPDVRDPHSRPLRPHGVDFSAVNPLRVAIPRAADREFFGDHEAAALFGAYVERLRALGAAVSEIDWAPFRRAGALLYESALVAERLEAAGALLRTRSSALLAPLREILGPAGRYTAREVFDAQHALKVLQMQTREVWERVDVLVVPTAPTIFTVGEMQADPVGANTKLELYTSFVNLRDLAATAVPGGVRKNGTVWRHAGGAGASGWPPAASCCAADGDAAGGGRVAGQSGPGGGGGGPLARAAAERGLDESRCPVCGHDRDGPGVPALPVARFRVAGGSGTGSRRRRDRSRDMGDGPWRPGIAAAGDRGATGHGPRAPRRSRGDGLYLSGSRTGRPRHHRLWRIPPVCAGCGQAVLRVHRGSSCRARMGACTHLVQHRS